MTYPDNIDTGTTGGTDSHLFYYSNLLLPPLDNIVAILSHIDTVSISIDSIEIDRNNYILSISIDIEGSSRGFMSR